MDSANTPEMSVVIATCGSYQSIRMVMGYLRAQAVADRLEIVIVAPSIKQLGLIESDLTGFCQYRVVEVGRIESLAQANAAGVRHAAAEIVALAEDHCFPAPGWAHALIAAHRGTWAAVGPVIINANPASAVSRCDFLIGYAPWMDRTPAGKVDMLPGHNSSYKRNVLLDLGNRLDELLEAETVLQAELRAQGHRLYLQPSAQAAHLNFARIRPWLSVQLNTGRLYASVRSMRWSWRHRLLYTAAAPLIPLVRAARILRQLQCRARLGPGLVLLAPLLMWGLAMDGLGQMIGYAIGAAGTTRRLVNMEFDRICYVTEQDRRALAEA